ncbi:MAG TPA: hypothetical protein VLH08_13655, partial [Acidobacteriota bacterium]|nr:hypothetical protein [Acidobacteriota bacterium]
SKPIAKRIGILSQPTLHVILVAITTGTTLLTVAYYSAPTMEMTINCIDHTVEGNELNRFEKVQIVYVASQPMEVKIKFGLLSPLWLHKIRQKKINGMAPGTSPNVYKVNGSDDHYHFTFICGTEPPSSGMVQIPRQY